MKHFVRLLMCMILLGLASASQATTIIGGYDASPSSTDNLWAYSLSDSGLSNANSYYIAIPSGNTHLGYVDGNAAHNLANYWEDSFVGNNSDGSDNTSIHVFETYIMSNIDQNIRIGLSGDDGHSIFINDTFNVGHGFYPTPNYVSTDFTMTADTQYKVSFVLNNAGGPWHANFNLALQQNDGSYLSRLFSNTPNISMNATGDFSSSPVPEPATMVLFGIGLLGLAGVSRRKK